MSATGHGLFVNAGSVESADNVGACTHPRARIHTWKLCTRGGEGGGSNHCFLRGANFGTGPTATAFRNHESVRGSGSNGILLTDTEGRESAWRVRKRASSIQGGLLWIPAVAISLARIHAYRAHFVRNTRANLFQWEWIFSLPPALSLSPSISVEWDNEYDVSTEDDVLPRAHARFAPRDTTLLDVYTRCRSVFFSVSFRRSPNFPKSLRIPSCPTRIPTPAGGENLRSGLPVLKGWFRDGWSGNRGQDAVDQRTEDRYPVPMMADERSRDLRQGNSDHPRK